MYTCPCRLSLLGGLKVGRKKLFIRSETGAYRELQPLCVLDFYVADSYQRMGLGKHIFEVSIWGGIADSCSVHLARPPHV